MNNFYTLIYLTGELNSKYCGSRFQQSYSFQKGIWEVVWLLPNGEEARWVYSARPRETALFPDQPRPPAKRNITRFFDSLEGCRLEAVTLAEGDRLITLHLSGSNQLLVQPFGSRPNIFHIRDGRVQESFRQSGPAVGDPAPAPRPKRDKPEPPSPEASAKQMILRADPAFPRPVIPHLIRQYDLEEANWEEIRDRIRSWQEQMRTEPVIRLLVNGTLTLLSEESLDLKTDRTFHTVSEAIRETWIRRQRESAWQHRHQRIEQALHNQISRLRKRLQQLEEPEEALERAETYEKYGHILTAYAHKEVHSGQTEIELPDPWNDEKPIRIPLPGSGTLADRARHYYRKSGSAKRSVEESRSIRQESRSRLQELEEASESFGEVTNLRELRQWEKDRASWLDTLFSSPDTSHQHESLPWRRYEINGWVILVGKSARGNDDLLRASHKEDLWLHARGSAGSHVILKMDGRSTDPPESVRLQAARLAAWFSKQRHSSLVPVMVTRSKYVTKPSGAPPGQVRVDREEVLMVPPEEPDKRIKPNPS